MSAQVYQDMLEVMKKRGGPYSGLDTPEFYLLVEELFTPQEAEMNNLMPRGPFTAQALAEKTGRDQAELEKILETMADKGLCTTVIRQGTRFYQGAPFMPGIFEFQFMPGTTGQREQKIARLIHDYKQAYKAAKAAAPMVFPATRVIPVDRHIAAQNQVHTYDQVATYIDKYADIGITTCYCRHAAALRGEDTHGMPLEVCMSFGPLAEYAVERLGGRKVNKQEALELLTKCEEAGLIHMSYNTTDEIDFLCNCDRWHCAVVSAMLEQPQPAKFFSSGYLPAFDEDACVACGTCVERCPPEALSLDDDGPPQVDQGRCFGCAVCATGCPEEAIAMQAKPGFSAPPKDRQELKQAIKIAYQAAQQ